jgi:hypothetical protein
MQRKEKIYRDLMQVTQSLPKEQAFMGLWKEDHPIIGVPSSGICFAFFEDPEQA